MNFDETNDYSGVKKSKLETVRHYVDSFVNSNSDNFYEIIEQIAKETNKSVAFYVKLCLLGRVSVEELTEIDILLTNLLFNAPHNNSKIVIGNELNLEALNSIVIMGMFGKSIWDMITWTPRPKASYKQKNKMEGFEEALAEFKANINIDLYSEYDFIRDLTWNSSKVSEHLIWLAHKK
jgi:hypothetical protein